MRLSTIVSASILAFTLPSTGRAQAEPEPIALMELDKAAYTAYRQASRAGGRIARDYIEGMATADVERGHSAEENADRQQYYKDQVTAFGISGVQATIGIVFASYHGGAVVGAATAGATSASAAAAGTAAAAKAVAVTGGAFAVVIAAALPIVFSAQESHVTILIANNTDSPLYIRNAETDSYLDSGRMVDWSEDPITGGTLIPSRRENAISLGVLRFEKKFGANGAIGATRLKNFRGASIDIGHSIPYRDDIGVINSKSHCAIGVNSRGAAKLSDFYYAEVDEKITGGRSSHFGDATYREGEDVYTLTASCGLTSVTDFYPFMLVSVDETITDISNRGDLHFHKFGTFSQTDLISDFRWFEGSDQRIGVGWQDFLHVFGGHSGVIYAVKPNGDLMLYKDEAMDGTSDWMNGQGQKIGNGWQHFKHVFGGHRGVIYAIKENGDLLFYKDLARDGTRRWSPASGQKIGNGWHNFRHVIGGAWGEIYAIRPNGDLVLYKDLARDGTRRWAASGGQTIGTGWTTFDHVVAVGQGRLFGVQPNGDVHYYVTDTKEDGQRYWQTGSGKVVATGWTGYDRIFGHRAVLYGTKR